MGWGFWHLLWDEDDISFNKWAITDVEEWKEVPSKIVKKLLSTLSEEQKEKLKLVSVVGATADGNDIHYHSPELPSEFYSIFDPNSEFTYNGEFSTKELAEDYLKNHYDKN